MNRRLYHLSTSKSKFIREFRDDIKKDFNIDVKEGHGFTRSEMFHFGVVENKKYVHKKSLEFVLTNGGTYKIHVPQTYSIRFDHNAEMKMKAETDIEKIFRFFREEINKTEIFPKLIEESENFFVFEFFNTEEWEQLEGLKKADAKFIKEKYLKYSRGKKEIVTPFFNQMARKLMRNKKTGRVVMIDIKSFEVRENKKLCIYMCNTAVNNLYLLQFQFKSLKKIIRPFLVDYPAQYAKIIKFYIA